jgi:hypothetical protein
VKLAIFGVTVRRPRVTGVGATIAGAKPGAAFASKPWKLPAIAANERTVIVSVLVPPWPSLIVTVKVSVVVLR